MFFFPLLENTIGALKVDFEFGHLHHAEGSMYVCLGGDKNPRILNITGWLGQRCDPGDWNIYLHLLGGGNSNICGIFTPKLGEDEPILTSIFFEWVGSTTN